MINSCFSQRKHLNKLHAKKIRKSLGLSLGRAQTIVAHIHNHHSWDSLNNANHACHKNHLRLRPLYFLPTKSTRKFINLITEYRSAFESEHLAFHRLLNDSLINLILKNQLNAIEHQQIDKILTHIDSTVCNAENLVDAVLYADNSACKALHLHEENISSSLQSKTINIWLEHDMFQQSLYAYYYFNQRQVNIKIQEWDSELNIPYSTKSTVNKRWFGDYAIGYLKMLAQQFVTLGYIPSFEVVKIQNIEIKKLNSDFEDNNHPNAGIYKLVLELINKYDAKIETSKHFDDTVLRIDHIWKKK